MISEFDQQNQNFLKSISSLFNTSNQIRLITSSADYHTNSSNTKIISHNLRAIIKLAKQGIKFAESHLKQPSIESVGASLEEHPFTREDTEGSLQSPRNSDRSRHPASISDDDLTERERLYYENQELEITLEMMMMENKKKKKTIEGLERNLRRYKRLFGYLMEPFKDDGIDDAINRRGEIVKISCDIARSIGNFEAGGVEKYRFNSRGSVHVEEGARVASEEEEGNS